MSMPRPLTRLVLVAWLGMAGPSWAGEAETSAAPLPDGHAERASQAAPEVTNGMPTGHAIALLGESPDGRKLIGAACGMLEVLTWEERRLRLISVDGAVTSFSRF